MPWLRSITAIVVGFIVDFGLILVTYSFIESDNVAIHHQTGGLLLLAGIAAVAGLVSGFVAASIAGPPRRLIPPIVLGVVLTITTALMTLNDLSDSGPVSKDPIWFLLALPVLALPTVVVGAWLRLLINRKQSGEMHRTSPLQLPDQTRHDEPAEQ